MVARLSYGDGWSRSFGSGWGLGEKKVGGGATDNDCQSLQNK